MRRTTRSAWLGVAAGLAMLAGCSSGSERELPPPAPISGGERMDEGGDVCPPDHSFDLASESCLPPGETDRDGRETSAVNVCLPDEVYDVRRDSCLVASEIASASDSADPRAEREQSALAPAMAQALPPAAAVMSSDEQFCELTQAFERAGDCERFDRQLAAVREGRHAFRPQQPMVRGRPAIVRYAIVLQPAAVQQGRGSAAERAAAIAAIDERVRGEIVRAGEAGSVRTEAIAVGRLMYACLRGDPSFTIAPVECATIDTLEHPDPVWRWQVTPQQKGEDLKLTLTSGIEIRTADGEVRRLGQFSRSENIDVTVSAEGVRDDVLADAEGWVNSPLRLLAALTALVAAIAALVAAIRKLRAGGVAPPGTP